MEDRPADPPGNGPADLHCRSCGARYEAGPDEPWRCTCGHALDFDGRSTHGNSRSEVPIDGETPEIDARRGLWAFAEFVPIRRRVSLDEGFTPLVSAPGWDADFKLEYVFPTGSFKDRGATTTLSRAVDLGVDRVLEDSSGNAGAAIATYGARAGLVAEIYVPADVKEAKLTAIRRAGAQPVRVEGDRAAVTAACVEAVEGGAGWYASHAWNPAFYAGTATVALEIAAQQDWSVPDAVVVPTGHGTLLLGAYRGFLALREAGIVDELPRLLAAQATGYAPVAAAFGDEAAGRNDLADGVQIAEPARKEQLVDAIEATDGDAIAVEEAAVGRALDRLHRSGFYVEPTAAVGPAALGVYRDRGVLPEGDDVVVPLTGSGLKAF